VGELTLDGSTITLAPYATGTSDTKAGDYYYRFKWSDGGSPPREAYHDY